MTRIYRTKKNIQRRQINVKSKQSRKQSLKDNKKNKKLDEMRRDWLYIALFTNKGGRVKRTKKKRI